MAYFSNGSEGMRFDEQCSKCKYGDRPCPIAWVQLEYNCKAVDEETAAKILNHLVKDDGTCTMYELAKDDLAL